MRASASTLRGGGWRAPRSLVFALLGCLYASTALMNPSRALAEEMEGESEYGVIRLQRPLNPDPLLDEAIVRAVGELQAAGFEVEVLGREGGADARPVMEPGSRGLLVFDRVDNQVVVQAFSASRDQPFVERFDAEDSDVTAEVIAVRAVEALRALLIRTGSAPKSQPPPAPSAPVSLPEEPQKPPPETQTAPLWHGTLFLGPALEGPMAGHVAWTARGGAFLGWGAVSLGGQIDTLLDPTELIEVAGTARITRQRYAGLLQLQMTLEDHSTAWTRAGAGTTIYQVNANAADGFVASDRNHRNVTGLLQIGMNYWAFPAVGFYFFAEGSAADRRARVRMAEQVVATLGAPAIAAAIGLTARIQ